MKITIESTTKMVSVNGIQTRLWEGDTESGIPVVAFIALVAVPDGHPTDQFKRELEERKLPTPSLAGAFDSHLIL